MASNEWLGLQSAWVETREPIGQDGVWSSQVWVTSTWVMMPDSSPLSQALPSPSSTGMCLRRNTWISRMSFQGEEWFGLPLLLHSPSLTYVSVLVKVITQNTTVSYSSQLWLPPIRNSKGGGWNGKWHSVTKDTFYVPHCLTVMKQLRALPTWHQN